MPVNFLSYWKPATAEQNLDGADPMFAHSASQQFGKRVRAGDTLWTVTVWPSGALTLLGRLVVGAITDAAGAARALGVRADDLWDADYHAVAAPMTVQPLREVDVSDLAAELRFDSENDRLAVVRGRVHANQLQTMRRLTPESAALLEARWHEAAGVGAALAAQEQEATRIPGDRGGSGFGPAETNHRVERAAVDAVTAQYRTGGWTVRSVEALRIGYDLHCGRAGAEEHVEVKGVRGTLPTFIITENEVAQAEADPAFVLYVVTNALSGRPRLQRLSGAEFLARYDLQPLAYRAVLPRAARAE